MLDGLVATLMVVQTYIFSLEILMPCGNKLVPPRLGKGQLLDASMVHKIFIRSPVYVRPSVALEVTEYKTGEPKISFA